MNNKKFKLTALLFLGLGLTGLQAQETITTSGGNASGNGGSTSYSVGQVVYTTNTGTTGSVAQGVQQVYEITFVDGIEDYLTVNFECSAYPNPTTDQLTLKIENIENLELSYQLFDINGKLLESKKINDNQTTISMVNQLNAIYFLKIYENQLEIKTFKIIKTK